MSLSFDAAAFAHERLEDGSDEVRIEGLAGALAEAIEQGRFASGIVDREALLLLQSAHGQHLVHTLSNEAQELSIDRVDLLPQPVNLRIVDHEPRLPFFARDCIPSLLAAAEAGDVDLSGGDDAVGAAAGNAELFGGALHVTTLRDERGF